MIRWLTGWLLWLGAWSAVLAIAALTTWGSSAEHRRHENVTQVQDTARRFSAAVCAALKGTADPNDLLVAADAALNTFRDGDDRIPSCDP